MKPTPQPARVLRVEIQPPQGANLPRAIDCARGVLAAYLPDSPEVSFQFEGLRITVRQDGTL